MLALGRTSELPRLWTARSPPSRGLTLSHARSDSLSRRRPVSRATTKAHPFPGADGNAKIGVSYGVRVLTNLSTAVHQGATLALVLKLTDAAGKNLSSSTVALHAIGIDGTMVAPAPGNSQPGQNFRFIRSNPSYQYNIKTSGLAVGNHSLAYTAGRDPTTHTAIFTVTKWACAGVVVRVGKKSSVHSPPPPHGRHLPTCALPTRNARPAPCRCL
jgi:hypothetical protein